MQNYNLNPEFWKNKKVLVTGHNGFKGSWMCVALNKMNSQVFGCSLEPETNPTMYKLIGLDNYVTGEHADVRDFKKIKYIVSKIIPDIVIHLAAQPLVSVGYENPLETFSTNVMGTANLLQACRDIPTQKDIVVIVVSSDKCYLNNEDNIAFKVGDPLGGKDPYSASKAATEMVYNSFQESFFKNGSNLRVSSVRAGNVIGGGDWSKNRLLADAIRAFSSNKPLKIRHPAATRPWQHVIEPILGYLKLAEKMSEDIIYCKSWNFGPDSSSEATVEHVINLFMGCWNGRAEVEFMGSENSFKEAHYLRLNCEETKSMLGIQNSLTLEEAVRLTVDWYHESYLNSSNDRLYEFTLKQIESLL